jgi:hypothetical protein
MLEVERLAGNRFETGSTASSKPAPLAGLPFQHKHKHHTSTSTSTSITSGPLHCTAHTCAQGQGEFALAAPRPATAIPHCPARARAHTCGVAERRPVPVCPCAHAHSPASADRLCLDIGPLGLGRDLFSALFALPWSHLPV